MNRTDAYRMIQRRARDAGVETKIGCHSFRATGITNYLQNGGTLDVNRARDAGVETKIGCHYFRATRSYRSRAERTRLGRTWADGWRPPQNGAIYGCARLSVAANRDSE
jgi:hypothetical protein